MALLDRTHERIDKFMRTISPRNLKKADALANFGVGRRGRDASYLLMTAVRRFL